MLWYKAWIDTRWRFSLALVLLVVGACGTVMSFPAIQRLAASLPTGALTGSESLQREIQESLDMVRTFRGYVWSQWFGGYLPELLTLFAALLGSGNALLRSGRGASFALALPVGRERWVIARVGLGLAELLVLALVPSVALAVLAPVIGAQLAYTELVIYGLCAFAVASLFFCLAVFLSTLFDDVWRPLLITCFAAVILAALGMLMPEDRGLFHAMGGGEYFFGGSLPWVELVFSAVAGVGLVFAAAAALARRDF